MFVLLGFMVDVEEAAHALTKARWGYLAWLALWITLDRLLMAYKWRVLLICRGLEISFWQTIRAYYLSTFAGCFLPSTVGGDAMRVACVTNSSRPISVLTASVALERTLGFVASAIAAALALSLLAGMAVDTPYGLVGWSLGILLASVLAVGVTLSKKPARWMATLPEKLSQKGRILGWVGKLLAAYGEYRNHPLALAWFLLLSIIEQSVPVVGTWLTALAFNIDLSLLESAAIAPLALLFTRIPVSVSGFGVVEGLYVAFFGLVGLSATDSFILGLIANLSIVITTLPGALFYAVGGLKGRESNC
jgi:hypothetical protein